MIKPPKKKLGRGLSALLGNGNSPINGLTAQDASEADRVNFDCACLILIATLQSNQRYILPVDIAIALVWLGQIEYGGFPI